MKEHQTTNPSGAKNRSFIIAWIFGLIFYFFEYVIRSSPAVMITELSEHFTVSALSVAGILGTYYYTYSITSLIAGVALDRSGGKLPISFGAITLAIGCLLFAIPHSLSGDLGRMLQGAGSAFAFTGCIYLASHGFSSKYIATAIGLTQCMGMLGGSMGQFVVGPIIKSGTSIASFWLLLGLTCAITGVLLFIITPKEPEENKQAFTINGILKPYQIVFTNPQSYLSGLLSGLLFAPTTIFAMTWGVAFFQQDRSMNYHSAVLLCSLVPLGWVIGCPFLGWVSDLIGKRKPVLICGTVVMLACFSQLTLLPGAISPYLSMFVFGVASGAAMIPYTMIKEANPDNVKGSATGAINFLTFSITALIGPVFAHLYGKPILSALDGEAHFKHSGIFIMGIMVLALFIGLIIRETGRNKSLKAIK